jgi:hypothetical protein
MTAGVVEGTDGPIPTPNNKGPLPKKVKAQPIAWLLEIVHMADNMPMVEEHSLLLKLQQCGTAITPSRQTIPIPRCL